MAADGRASTGRRVVMFPFPLGSHITPMLQLAELLRDQGLGVTVLHTDLNAPDPVRHPDLTFVSIREFIPADVVADPDMAQRIMRMNDACEAPFQAALEELVRGGGGLQPQVPRQVACVVVDGHWYRMLTAARRVGVSPFVFPADGAAMFFTMLATPRLHANGYVAVEEEDDEERQLDEVVQGLEPLRVRDLIGVGDSSDDTALEFMTCVADAMWSFSAALVVNTFDDIEGPELAKIQNQLCRPAFAVGPLHLASPATAQHAAPAEPDRSCLAWLNVQPARSVLYVSLGTTLRVDRATFEDMAWALAGSGVHFLWVLRRGFVFGSDEVPLFPEELRESVRGRGKIVAWSPQKEVLAHRAVGGFWTHCGWNSTMEAIAEGVPMLAHPCSTDNTVIARYVTHQWGNGLEVGDGEVFDRADMAKTIRRLMVTDLGPLGPWERAQLLKMQACLCVAEGGQARLTLDDLVRYIVRL